MATLRHGSMSYTTTVGSDVLRDGFFAELCQETGTGLLLVAEAFWSDATSEFTFTGTEHPIPFSVLENFLQEARQRVPPTGNPEDSNLFTLGVIASDA
jgi:hypothetical protein